MTVSIAEQTVAGLRWVVVAGPRLAAFRALGGLALDEIHEVVESMPERQALERFVATTQGRAVLGRVVAETARAQPAEYAELAALAAGAGIDFDTILLANLRGDLGGHDGTGCSDLGWRRARSLVAHNEDGAPALQGRFMLLTLAIDGEVPVTTEWYAGFLPSNTLAVTGHGLVWGINHVQVSVPAAGAGRHFVARGLQQVRSLDAAIDYLSTHVSAGGFTYTFGEAASGRVATAEAAAGRVAVAEAGPATGSLMWHTNHLRYLDGEPTSPPEKSLPGEIDPSVADKAARSLGLLDESMARGCVLDALPLPAAEPSPDWFLDILTSAAPDGVYRSAEHGDPLMTLCSAATDLTASEVTLQPRGGPRVRLPLADLAAGRLTAVAADRR
jgi:hypothetical protein